MPTVSDYVIVVEALNRAGLVLDLTNVVSQLNCDIQGFNAYKHPDGVTAEAHIYLSKTTSEQHTHLLKELEKVASVTKIEIIPTIMLPPSNQGHSLNMPSYRSNPYGPGLATESRFYGRE